MVWRGPYKESAVRVHLEAAVRSTGRTFRRMKAVKDNVLRDVRVIAVKAVESET